MQQPLAHTVTLHRVRPRSPTNVCASLEPLVVFSEEGIKDNSTRDACSAAPAAKESIVEHHAALRILLECFTGKLLASQSESSAIDSPSSAFGTAKDNSSNLFDAYRTHGSAVGASLLSPEGLFIEVPSRRFVSACARAAVSSASDTMDIVQFNQSILHSRAKGGDSGCHDDGYVYGFVQYMPFGYVGDSAEGMLLGVFSRNPLLTLLRVIVLETIPRIARVTAELWKNCSRTEGKSVPDLASVSMRRVIELYTGVLAPLAELVSLRGSPNTTTPGRSFTLRFGRSPVTFIRPDDARCPLISLPLTTLLLSFSYKAIRVVQSLLLQEQRVIFIGATAQHAAACVVSVPALLAPFVWSHPLVPFLPDTASCVLGLLAKDSGSFVLGVTADMVPQLMLHIDLAGGLAEGRLWFADGRTGMVAAGVRDLDLSAFVSVNVMPPSEKLKDALKRIVPKEQRRMFRVALDRRGTTPFSFGAFSGTPATAFHSLEELHVAFVEYNVSRLVGNYRKGLPPMSRTGSGGSGGQMQSASGASVVLDYTRFLQANLEGNVVLAQRIAKTRMFHHWSNAVTLMETIGLTRCLLGEFLRVPRSKSLSASHIEPKSYSGSFVPHYYFSNARMVSLLCLFFSRAVRRFPELYPDLNGCTFLRVCESGNGMSEMGGTNFDTKHGTVSADNTSNGDGKGRMRALFSRATKAVKNSLATYHPQVSLQVFIQAYGSFTRRLGGDGDLHTPGTLNKQYWDSQAPAQPDSTNSATGTAELQACAGEESKLYGLASSSYSAGDSSIRPAVSKGTVCRRLPLDLIHQFEHYHALLNPTREAPYTTGSRGSEEALSGMSLDQLELFIGFGQMLAGEPTVWQALERAREALLCRRKEQQERRAYELRCQENKKLQEPIHGQERQALQMYSQQEQMQQRNQEEVQPSIGLHKLNPAGKTSNAPVDVSGVPFEAQPLPFSPELITSAPVLPSEWQPKKREIGVPATASGTQHGISMNSTATTYTIATLQQWGGAPPEMTSSSSVSVAVRPHTATARRNDLSSAPVALSSQNSASETVMDWLFDFDSSPSASNAVVQPRHVDPKKLEDFFS